MDNRHRSAGKGATVRRGLFGLHLQRGTVAGKFRRIGAAYSRSRNQVAAVAADGVGFGQRVAAFGQTVDEETRLCVADGPVARQVAQRGVARRKGFGSKQAGRGMLRLTKSKSRVAVMLTTWRTSSPT